MLTLLMETAPYYYIGVPAKIHYIANTIFVPLFNL
jgi:hypothetical protein